MLAVVGAGAGVGAGDVDETIVVVAVMDDSLKSDKLQVKFL